VRSIRFTESYVIHLKTQIQSFHQRLRGLGGSIQRCFIIMHYSGDDLDIAVPQFIDDLFQTATGLSFQFVARFHHAVPQVGIS